MKPNKFCYWLLTISAVVLLINSTQLSAQTCTPPPAGMVAWFPGDGNANDIQGSNNGTINGGVTFPAGKVAQAFQFDGTGDVTYSTVNAGGAYTVDFWFRPTRNGGFENLVSNDYLDGQNYGQLYFFGGSNLIAYYQGGSGVVPRLESAPGSVPLNTYTHLALTYDGSVNRLYLNGNLVGTSGVHTETFNNAIRLGYSIANRDNRFAGQIDEVEIFSRALSQTEIQAIVTADSAGKCKPPVTYVVNTTSDINDGACNTAHCSLREAIIAANANAGRDAIAFNIPGAGVQTINVGSSGLGALPTVTDPVVIDGYTQPGATANTNQNGAINAVLKIELNGAGAGANANGLRITAGGSTVRGLVINRFPMQGFASGILLEANGNLIEGNFIGTNDGGSAALGNSFGVRVFSSNNTIGGITPAARNVISGNLDGVQISGNNNFIQGNLIGTTSTGTVALGNTFVGVFIGGANNTIGGTTIAARNIISGNGRGIELNEIGVSDNLIQGNFIGTDVSGTANLGNNLQGIKFVTTLTNNIIGGIAPGAGNIIAFNGEEGVFVDGSTTGIRILSNSIFSNSKLGIELQSFTGATGVTPNDTGDADTGANNLQNYPVLSSASNSGSGTIISGTFNSTPNTQFRIEFFFNSACDGSGFGEGQFFLNSQNVTTDPNGNATINFTSLFTVEMGQFITSTATDPNGNTSEFSACRQVLAPTAATVSVGGRVTTSKGDGIFEALVSITDAKGETHTVLTDESGYYHFEQAEAGETYIVSVSRKRYQFMPSTRVISVSEELNSIDFTALPLRRMKQW